MIDCVLRKYGHKPKYRKVKYYGPSDYKPITGTVVTPEQSLAVPNGLQNTIYDAFSDAKAPCGTEPVLKRCKQLLSLKDRYRLLATLKKESSLKSDG